MSQPLPTNASLLFVLLWVVNLSFVENVAAADKLALTNQAFAREQQVRVWPNKVLRLMLIEKRYSELNALYAALEESSQADISHEGAWIFSLEEVGAIAERAGAREAYLPFFDEWVAEDGTPHARAARAHFYLALAWAARGAAYMSDTSYKQRLGMREYVALAQKEFSNVLEMDEAYIPAYHGLITAGMLTANEELENLGLKAGLKHSPLSFWLRSAYLDGISPLWGGSYEEMKNFVAGFQDIGNKNPRLWSLGGMPDAAISKRFGNRHEYAEALQLLSKALRYGDRFHWLKLRMYYSYQIRDYDQVIVDARRIASYGVGQERAEYIVERMEQEKNSKAVHGQGVAWGTFSFDTRTEYDMPPR